MGCENTQLDFLSSAIKEQIYHYLVIDVFTFKSFRLIRLAFLNSLTHCNFQLCTTFCVHSTAGKEDSVPSQRQYIILAKQTNWLPDRHSELAKDELGELEVDFHAVLMSYILMTKCDQHHVQILQQELKNKYKHLQSLSGINVCLFKMR